MGFRHEAPHAFPVEFLLHGAKSRVSGPQPHQCNPANPLHPIERTPPRHQDGPRYNTSLVLALARERTGYQHHTCQPVAYLGRGFIDDLGAVTSIPESRYAMYAHPALGALALGAISWTYMASTKTSIPSMR